MDEIKDIYRRYKLIIWPVFSGLASVIILALVIVPQFFSYLKIKDQISLTENHSSKLDAKAAELEQFDQSVTKRKLETAFTVLPSDQDVPKSLAILQSIVRSSALELKSTNFVSSRKGKGKESFQLTITVSGPIGMIRSFLLTLKDSPQIFQVESINIKFLRTGSVVEAAIPISVFYEGISQVQSKPDQPLPKLTQDEEELLLKFSKITAGLEGSSSAVSESVPLGKSDPFE